MYPKLYIDDKHYCRVDIERYDQEASLLDPSPGGLHLCVALSYFVHCINNFSLNVPGLAEKRPSLIVGDRILLRQHGGPPRWWSGYVHKVELHRVGLRFHHGFRPLRGQKFDVRFTLNRMILQRMHQGLDSGGLNPRILFPTEADVKSKKPSEEKIRTLNPINRLVGQNPSQMLAVTAIRDLPPKSPPFVIFGP